MNTTAKSIRDRIATTSDSNQLIRGGFGDTSWPSNPEADRVLKKILASRKKDPFEGILCPPRKKTVRKRKRKSASNRGGTM